MNESNTQPQPVQPPSVEDRTFLGVKFMDLEVQEGQKIVILDREEYDRLRAGQK